MHKNKEKLSGKGEKIRCSIQRKPQKAKKNRRDNTNRLFAYKKELFVFLESVQKSLATEQSPFIIQPAQKKRDLIKAPAFPDSSKCKLISLKQY